MYLCLDRQIVILMIKRFKSENIQYTKTQDTGICEDNYKRALHSTPKHSTLLSPLFLKTTLEMGIINFPILHGHKIA